MKKRRIIALILTLVMATFMFAACGGSDSPASAPDSSAPASNAPASNAPSPAAQSPGASSSAAAGAASPAPESQAPANAAPAETVKIEYTYDYLIELAAKVTQPVNIRIGLGTAGKHYQNFMVDTFKEVIEEVSDKITVEVFPGGQLGTIPQMMESVLSGALGGIAFPAAYLSTVAPAISVLELPFLFADPKGSSEQAYRVLNGGTSLDGYLYDKGFVPVAWLRSGDNYLMTLSEVRGISDLQGRKLRCHSSEFVQETVKLLGAVPTMIDVSELTSALQNGTIDGTEADPVFTVSQSMHQIAKYYTLLPMRPNEVVFVLSAELWDTYSKEAQDLIYAVNQYVVRDREYDYFLNVEANSFKAMEEEGVQIFNPDDAFISELRSLTAGVATNFINKNSDCAAIYSEFVDLIAADNAAR